MPDLNIVNYSSNVSWTDGPEVPTKMGQATIVCSAESLIVLSAFAAISAFTYYRFNAFTKDLKSITLLDKYIKDTHAQIKELCEDINEVIKGAKTESINFETRNDAKEDLSKLYNAVNAELRTIFFARLNLEDIKAHIEPLIKKAKTLLDSKDEVQKNEILDSLAEKLNQKMKSRALFSCNAARRSQTVINEYRIDNYSFFVGMSIAVAGLAHAYLILNKL